MSINQLITALDNFYDEYNTCKEANVQRMCKSVQDFINVMNSYSTSLSNNQSVIQTQKDDATSYLEVYTRLLAE